MQFDNTISTIASYAFPELNVDHARGCVSMDIRVSTKNIFTSNSCIYWSLQKNFVRHTLGVKFLTIAYDVWNECLEHGTFNDERLECLTVLVKNAGATITVPKKCKMFAVFSSNHHVNIIIPEDHQLVELQIGCDVTVNVPEIPLLSIRGFGNRVGALQYARPTHGLLYIPQNDDPMFDQLINDCNMLHVLSCYHDRLTVEVVERIAPKLVGLILRSQSVRCSLPNLVYLKVVGSFNGTLAQLNNLKVMYSDVKIDGWFPELLDFRCKTYDCIPSSENAPMLRIVRVGDATIGLNGAISLNHDRMDTFVPATAIVNIDKPILGSKGYTITSLDSCHEVYIPALDKLAKKAVDDIYFFNDETDNGLMLDTPFFYPESHEYQIYERMQLHNEKYKDWWSCKGHYLSQRPQQDVITKVDIVLPDERLLSDVHVVYKNTHLYVFETPTRILYDGCPITIPRPILRIYVGNGIHVYSHDINYKLPSIKANGIRLGEYCSITLSNTNLHNWPIKVTKTRTDYKDTEAAALLCWSKYEELISLITDECYDLEKVDVFGLKLIDYAVAMGKRKLMGKLILLGASPPDFDKYRMKDDNLFMYKKEVKKSMVLRKKQIAKKAF